MIPADTPNTRDRRPGRHAPSSRPSPFQHFAKTTAETIKTWLEIAGMLIGMLGMRRVWRRWRQRRDKREEESQRMAAFHEAVPALLEIPGRVEHVHGEMREGMERMQGQVQALALGVRHVAEITGRHGALTEIMAQANPTPLWRTDAEGLCTWVNHAFEEAVGVGAGEILGSNWKQRIHPEDREAFVEGWEEAVRRVRPFKGRCRYLHPVKIAVPVLAEGGPYFDAEGRVIGYSGSLEVLEERR